jgi:ATP-dependent RNA helicase RhlE
VNYELPMVAEDYVHRIGRTGRAEKTGDAISLVCVDEAPLLREIEKLLGRSIPVEVIPGFEPDRSIRPEPIRGRSAGPRETNPGRGIAHRPMPVGQRHRPSGTRDRGPVVGHAGPVRQALPAQVAGANGSGRRGPNRGGARPGQRDPRRRMPAGTAIGNGAAPRGGWAGGNRPDRGYDPRAGRSGGPREDRDGRHGGNPIARRSPVPSGEGFRALPGERLARAERHD